jgi:hypothetical protein
MWDFTASHIAIFEELAELLEKGQQEEALARFIRMPKNAKDAIDGKLYEIGPFVNGLGATSIQKAQAIRSYLNDQPPQKLSSFNGEF